MKLQNSGTITLNGHNIRRAADGTWVVSRKGITLGSVDLLMEVQPLIDAHLARVKARVVMSQRIADERAAEKAAL